LPEDDKIEVYRAVQSNIYRYKRRRLLRRIGSAAAVLMIGILSVLFFTHKEDSGSVIRLGDEIIIGQTLPEEEIILISGGERINIAHKSHIGLTGDGKALVTDSTDSKKELLLTTLEFNKLVVPYGKRTNLILSDGTEIWLNSGTQLDFPAEFTGSRREVRVNGEIFINVAHNPEIPFVVHAQGMDIHVYGTSFNISAYHDDSRKTVVLVEGKVKIETAGRHTAELLPNEKIEITGDDMTKESVNVTEYISWTRGVLEFNETPVSEILKKIGRYYNVQFESSPDVKLNDKTCSGKLFLSNNLDSVMTSVSVLSSTVYQRENNIIHITKK
jgi:transmembrane sensor